MEVIKFKNCDDFMQYIESNTVGEIGRGREGSAFLTNNDRVIKYIKSGLARKYCLTDERLLTTDKVWLEHFYLPETLFAIGNQIIGYETRYFSNDLFSKKGKIDQQFVDRLVMARAKLLEEIKLLYQLHYFVLDLPPNILFDGKEFACIDTLNYQYKPKVRLVENQVVLDNAICCALTKYDSTFKYQHFGSLELTLKKNNYSIIQK